MKNVSFLLSSQVHKRQEMYQHGSYSEKENYADRFILFNWELFSAYILSVTDIEINS